MGSLVAAGGVAGACFWLPIYPVSACPLLDGALHVPHAVLFPSNVSMSSIVYQLTQMKSVKLSSHSAQHSCGKLAAVWTS